MKKFNGFPDGDLRLVPVPAQFFIELLSDIDHLGELKVILYGFWLLDCKEGSLRYFRRTDFWQDERFMRGLSRSREESRNLLEEALGRAVEDGVFLKATVDIERGKEDLYFLNSPKGRAAVQAIHQGDWHYTGDAESPVAPVEAAPNIFRLYEDNIGLLTPMIADALRDAEQTYPLQWIEEAIRIAVEKNARNWRYVSAILNRWQEEGRDERKDRRDTEKARRRYSEWQD